MKTEAMTSVGFPMWLAVAVSGLAGMVAFFIMSYHRPKNIPPGPIRIPIFGNTTFAGTRNKLLKHFPKLRRRYGDIFSIYIGNQ